MNRVWLCLSLLLSIATAATAQSAPEYIQFSPSAVKGALYRPTGGTAPHVAVLLIHRTSNFLSHLATRELASRGFMVLAMNPRSDNNPTIVDFEANALDVKSGIQFLRKQPGITHVVLFGHSGGGPASSFYQAVAEKGPSYCQGPTKLVQCGNELAGLPRADGVVLVDAHPGISVNTIRSINPAVTNDADPKAIDPSLDPFNPANGYDAKGTPTYPEAFQQRYFKAQAARMARLIASAQQRLAQIEAGKGPYPDDDVFLMVRGDGARLMEIDPSVHHATLKPRKLVKNDGTVVTQIVESVRRPVRDQRESNATFMEGTRLLTLRSFLSTNAIRATDSMSGIDWCSSNNSTPCAVQQITVPLLVTAMGAHYFLQDNELHYDLAASQDKDYIIIEGATHGITPCKACETTPGQYSNAVKNFFDYVAAWITKRF